MINYIKIEGYKSIKRLEIEFESINVLIGANGVGKSNFISFFKLVHEIYEKRLENYSLKKGAETLLHFGSRFTSEIKAHLEFDKKNGYKLLLEPTENNTLFIKKEQALFDGNKGETFQSNTLFEKTFAYNSKESQLKNENDSFGMGMFVSTYLRSFKIYHFHDTSLTSRLRTPSMLSDNVTLREDGDNLAAYLYLKRKTQ